MLSDQLDAGRDYRQLKAAVGIHLLDFDLFNDGEKQQQQALWRFEMRDETQPEVRLGNELQLNIIELRKADRLAHEDDTLHDWITFFEHWQEDARMATISHEPIKQAVNRIRQLSGDEEAKRLAFVRERALHDEASLMHDAREEGREKGREEGRLKEKRDTTRNMIALSTLTDEEIATITELSLVEVQQLRK